VVGGGEVEGMGCFEGTGEGLRGRGGGWGDTRVGY